MLLRYCANCIGNEYARALITVNENASPGVKMFCEALLAVSCLHVYTNLYKQILRLAC